MFLTSSRILSCGVWLILMRNTSAPASNSRRIMALSDDAGPSVARILIRRRRLMAYFRAQRLGDQRRPEAFRPAGWAGWAYRPLAPTCREEPRAARWDRRFRESLARAARAAARWIR